jgi:hypothetical protein
MKIAMARRYAVIPICKSIGLAPKDSAIFGRAVAMIVPSRFSMKNAPATNNATRTERRADDIDQLILEAFAGRFKRRKISLSADLRAWII